MFFKCEYLLELPSVALQALLSCFYSLIRHFGAAWVPQNNGVSAKSGQKSG